MVVFVFETARTLWVGIFVDVIDVCLVKWIGFLTELGLSSLECDVTLELMARWIVTP